MLLLKLGLGWSLASFWAALTFPLLRYAAFAARSFAIFVRAWRSSRWFSVRKGPDALGSPARRCCFSTIRACSSSCVSTAGKCSGRAGARLSLSTLISSIVWFRVCNSSVVWCNCSCVLANSSCGAESSSRSPGNRLL